jgi:hypothetical protein
LLVKARPAPTDVSCMRFAFRQLVGALLVCTAIVATTGVFTFAKPVYRPPNASKTIDFSQVDYFSPRLVRSAFARHGIVLRGITQDGFQLLSNRKPPWPAASLQLAIAPHDGKASWGSKLEAYDERFGNVFVTYGGHDAKLLRRVKAAVADIRKDS